MIVVDTNVIAYLVIEGKQTAMALSVFRIDAEWAAPQLWRSEMRNLLSLYLRNRQMTIDEAVLAMNRSEAVIAGREYDVNSSRVLELAGQSGCTAYDCEFAYLAEKLTVPLVTADKKLLAAFPDIAVSMEAFSFGAIT